MESCAAQCRRENSRLSQLFTLPTTRAVRHWIAACALALVCVTTVAIAEPPGAAPSFAALVERLSEPGGDFAGDNLISNEQSYLHVMPALERAGVRGSAFIGLGPDQNYTYIAQIKPEIAYIIDIRRENVLLHLLFKAIFAESATRIEYLCRLTGRALPEQSEPWTATNIDALVEYIDAAKPVPVEEQKAIEQRLDERIAGFGIPLTDSDREIVTRSHQEFVRAGLSLVFRARGQPLRSYYPTLRTLLRENDGQGHQLSFLADEARFQFVRSLHAHDRIVPVVGDVAGRHAMRAIAADMAARGLRLSAFYISNVEYYLFQNRTFATYAGNVQALPHDERSVVIRSVFPSGGSRALPQAVAGYYSTSLVQPFAAMLADLEAGKYRTYRDLVYASAQADSN